MQQEKIYCFHSRFIYECPCHWIWAVILRLSIIYILKTTSIQLFRYLSFWAPSQGGQNGVDGSIGGWWTSHQRHDDDTIPSQPKDTYHSLQKNLSSEWGSIVSQRGLVCIFTSSCEGSSPRTSCVKSSLKHPVTNALAASLPAKKL